MNQENNNKVNPIEVLSNILENSKNDRRKILISSFVTKATKTINPITYYDNVMLRAMGLSEELDKMDFTKIINELPEDDQEDIDIRNALKELYYQFRNNLNNFIAFDSIIGTHNRKRH